MIARLIQLLLYCTCLIVLLYLSMFYCTHHGLNLHPPSPMYMYLCIFVSCKMLFIYQSFKEIYIIFSLFVPHQFLAVCCSASGIHFPCTPTNPNNFHTIDLNLLLTLSTILFEIFKMFLPTLMISKINE